MTLLEGLRHSHRPCARVLSVAGLLVIIGLFPGGRRFIPEVKRDPFLGRKAGTVDVTTRTAFTVSNTAVMTVSRLAMGRVYREIPTYWAW